MERILNQKSFSQDRNRCRGASLELHDEAGVLADPGSPTALPIYIRLNPLEDFVDWYSQRALLLRV